MPHCAGATTQAATQGKDKYDNTHPHISDLFCSYTAVAQMVEALCYKPEGREFESR
jgi:hypothetical protein